MSRELIYTIQDDGKLQWYRHDRTSGDVEGPTTVDEGWDFRQVFSDGEGVIYAIKDDGELVWRRHDGRADGSCCSERALRRRPTLRRRSGIGELLVDRFPDDRRHSGGLPRVGPVPPAAHRGRRAR